jgi:uncharacterized LabA/DUF88 family protein
MIQHSSTRYIGPGEITYLFIDGGYFRGVIDKFEQEIYGGTRVPVDYSQLSRGFTKIFYYDCQPARRQNEIEEEFDVRKSQQEKLFRHLRSLRGWHIHEGVIKRTGKRARQKEVDILIAVDLLTHTHRRNMHRAAFIAGDQDFRPLVEAIVRDGMFLELFYDPSSVSLDLIDAADARHPLDPYTIHDWLEPSFRKAYPLPSRNVCEDKMIPSSTPLDIGVSDFFGSVELYEDKNEFLIVHAYPDDPERYLHMGSKDLQLLKKIHEKTYGPCEWRSQSAAPV